MTLFIATSLDGFIAGPDDDISWLFTDADYGFNDFFSTVDALIMGRGTYEVVKSFGKWPYQGKRSVVVSRKPEIPISTPDTAPFSGDPSDLVRDLEAEGLEHVWLVGGGELVASFLERRLVDEIVISLHPVLLSTGVPLFPGRYPRTFFALKDAESYESGLVKLTYQVMRD